MDRIKKIDRIREIETATTHGLFAVLNDYIKRTIAEDLKQIYREEAHLLTSNDHWVFELKK